MSIFSDDNKQKGNWWKPKAIGDKIEGTLVGKRQVPNNLQGGDQTAYDLKVSEEIITDSGKKITPSTPEIWTVFGKPGIDAQTRYINLGQVIGLKFTEVRPATRPGMNATHVIQVYANPEIVDEEWMKLSDEEKEAAYSTESSASDGATHTPEDLAQGNATAAKEEEEVDADALLEEINKLATEKLGAKTPEEMKSKVMEATKLAFIEANLPQIKAALEAIK